MDVVYLPEVDVHKRYSLMKKPYAAHERLCGVVRHLLHFLSKTELLSDQLRVHPLREQICAMKKSCLYKSINYAIALSCKVYDTNVDALRKLPSYLPHSNVSWLRFSRIFLSIFHSYTYCISWSRLGWCLHCNCPRCV